MVDVFVGIINKSLSPEEVSQKNRVLNDEINKILKIRKLYRFNINNQWEITKFQFMTNTLTPNAAIVNKLLSADPDPISICQWYTLERYDFEKMIHALLVTWLKSGFPVRNIIDAIPSE